MLIVNIDFFDWNNVLIIGFLVFVLSIMLGNLWIIWFIIVSGFMFFWFG